MLVLVVQVAFAGRTHVVLAEHSAGWLGPLAEPCSVKYELESRHWFRLMSCRFDPQAAKHRAGAHEVMANGKSTYIESCREFWLQGLAQELRRRLRLNLFNFDLLRPSPNQPGAPVPFCGCAVSLAGHKSQ